MRIFSWNVNGLRAVLKKEVFLPFIKAHRPDILCLQETKATPDQVALDLSDYHIHWHSAQKKGYSGTAIVSAAAPLVVHTGVPPHIASAFPLADHYGDATTEGRVLALEFAHFFVVAVYTPNAKDDLSRIPLRVAWDPAFCAYIKELDRKKPVVVCGDLNVAHTPLDLARPKENEGKKGFTPQEREGFEALLRAGFVDTFRLFTKEGGHYTWWSYFHHARQRNIGWRIDYILVSRRIVPLVQHARIHADVEGSDHCPVSIELTPEE